MPRGIGASDGIIVRLVAPLACLISGTWRWAPTLYAVRSPMTSLPSRFVSVARPAPDVPLDELTTTSAGSATPAATSGAMPRMAAAAWHPVLATRVDAAMQARWPGSSGNPYVQASWNAPP